MEAERWHSVGWSLSATATNRKAKLAGNLALLAVGMAIGVVLLEVTSRILMPQWRAFFSGRFMKLETVPHYGRVTVGRAGFDGYFSQNNGDFRVRIVINHFGLRNDEPVTAADGRVWVVGDSFAFGWGVESDEVLAAVIARQTGLASYNVASPGTDVCGHQALVARMPSDREPRAVIVGLSLENDVWVYDCRARANAMAREMPPDPDPVARFSLNEIKGFLIRHSALYNFLAVNLKQVDIVNQFLISIGVVTKEHGYKRPYASDRIVAAAQDTARELAHLRTMFAKGTPFAVVLIAARFEVRDGDPFYRQLRESVKQEILAQGMTVIDPFDVFRATGFAPTHFAHDGHWSPLGHKIAGSPASRWLKGVLDSVPFRKDIHKRPKTLNDRR